MEEKSYIEDGQIKLLEILHIVIKRKMLIFKVCAAAILVSITYCLTLPNIYSATSKILPPQRDAGGGLSALLGQAGGLAGLAVGGLGGGSDLYIGILNSRSVADSVIKRLNLVKVYEKESFEETRRCLKSAVHVQLEKEGIITITAEDKDPKQSAILANTFVDELQRTTVRLNLSKAGTERTFLERRLDLVKHDLKKAEDDLKDFAERNKIVEVDSQAKASIEGIARMKAELASKEVQLSVLRSMQTEQSPDIKALLRGIQQLNGQIAKLSGNDSGGEGIPSVGSVPSVGLAYSRKMRELKTQEAIFEQLTKQYEMAKLSEAKDSSSVQVLDEAVVPSKKSKPFRALIVILAGLSAFMVAVIFVFLSEYIQIMPEKDRKLLDRIKKDAFALK